MVKIQRKLKRKRKQKRNGGGHLRGALRAPQAGSLAFVSVFIFVSIYVQFEFEICKKSTQTIISEIFEHPRRKKPYQVGQRRNVRSNFFAGKVWRRKMKRQESSETRFDKV